MCRRTIARCESDCFQEVIENAECQTQCTSDHMVMLGKFLVEKLNKMISEKIPNMCYEWQFKNVITYEEILDRATGKVSYLVGVVADPARATFKGELVKTDNNFTVKGIVERTSMYGKTADCLKGMELREFCYCLK